MCGICGIYMFREVSVPVDLLQRMTSILSHRGPDGDGRYIGERVGLGHRRLSIIDLQGGAQPIANEDDTIHVVFNGEIYNFIELRKELESKGHIFRTSSDTEVIVHGYEQWGIDCVTRFNGIFAFALWDDRSKRLFLARDHLGVKPLYYTFIKDKLLFASEIKSLLQHDELSREVDIRSLGKLFTFRYVPSPDTLFSGIKKLSPGHRMVLEDEQYETSRYWKWKPHIVTNKSESEWLEQYQFLMEDSIRLQLRSDVPVGLFLSSGIDSAGILAIMRKYVSDPVFTFTIGFEEGKKTNETDDARLIAKIFGATHTEMVVSHKDYEEYYERYMWDLEEPVGNETAAAFYFVSKMASKKVKVALTGQGADEPWAGYHRHIGVRLSEYYRQIPEVLSSSLKHFLLRLPRSERLKRGVLSLDEPDVLTRFAKVYSFYSAEMKSNLFQAWVKNEISFESYEDKEALRILHSDVSDLDPLAQMLYIDTRANLPDDLLMVNDKTSMANSIEARVPYLDYRLVELIETIPSCLKLKRFRGKHLHKRALEKWLPKNMIYKKKKGFSNPIHNWLRKGMLNFLRERLLDDSSGISLYFNRDYVEELIKLHQERKESLLRQLYLLLSFQLWYNQYIKK